MLHNLQRLQMGLNIYGEASDSGDGDDHCSKVVPITDVIDLPPNGNVTLTTIKMKIESNNNIESLKAKLECVVATCRLMKRMSWFLLNFVFADFSFLLHFHCCFVLYSD